MNRLIASIGFVLTLSVFCSHAFMIPGPSQRIVVSTTSSTTTTTTTIPTSTALFIDKKWFAPSEEEEEEEEEARLVTREMLLRDMMEDPVVKRKRKGKNGGTTGYKPLDNRDHLPFAVQKITPDPYTHPKVKNANRNRVKSKKTDLDHLMTSSRLYEKKQKGGKGGDDASTLLGEFKLDKSTTSGDIIQIGDREYRVESARCQYKYAGGQRFVMVRKILEVKEIARALKEDLLMLQFSNDSGSITNGTVISPPQLE